MGKLTIGMYYNTHPETCRNFDEEKQNQMRSYIEELAKEIELKDKSIAKDIRKYLETETNEISPYFYINYESLYEQSKEIVDNLNNRSNNTYLACVI